MNDDKEFEITEYDIQSFEELRSSELKFIVEDAISYKLGFSDDSKFLLIQSD